MAVNLFAKPSTSKSEVSFRAGKLRREGTMVVSDPRKGKITVGPGLDGLTQFSWTDRATNQVEDTITVLPHEASWKSVKQCTTGRVFILEVHQQKHFFWMQEPNDAKDEDIAKAVNEALNHTPAAGPAGSDIAQMAAMFGGHGSDEDAAIAAAIAASLEGSSEAQENLEDGASEQAEAMEETETTGETALAEEMDEAAEAEVAEERNAEEVVGDDDMAAAIAMSMGAELQHDEDEDDELDDDALAAAIAMSMGGEETSAPTSAVAVEPSLLERLKRSLGAPRQAGEPMSINDIVSGDIVPFLTDDVEAMEMLRDCLPEGQQTDSEVLSVIRSPQMLQAMNVLTYALNSGAGAPIFHDLRIDPSTPPGVEAFLRALQRKIEEEEAEKRTSE